MNTSRRQFLQRLAVSAGAVSALPACLCAAEPERVKEDDALAKQFGYNKDSSKVDNAKYPTHKSENMCKGCMLYTGKADAAEGPCTIFQNKLVASKGWCVAFAPKPKA